MAASRVRFLALVAAAVSAAALSAPLSAPLSAAEPDDAATRQLRAEVAALRAEVAELRQRQNASWRDEKRAEQVREVVREVLADADTRGSLLAEGGYLGISEAGKVKLASDDGAFEMVFGGQIQFRGIAGLVGDDGATSNADEFGFQLRRTKLDLSGHIGSPEFEYGVVLAVDREDGGVAAEDVVIGYDFGGGFDLEVGRRKLPFARQELVSSKRQLAVDRSSVHEFFTLDRSEMVKLNYDGGEMWKATAAVSDGGDSGHTDFGGDGVEFAVTGRVDVKLAGDWGQAKDITSWRDDGLGVFVGGAAHYEAGDGNNAQPFDYATYTVDALVNVRGASLLAAIYQGLLRGDRNDGIADRDPFGVLVEGGYRVTHRIEPFARWEYLDDDAAGDALQLATVGVNYYPRKHQTKLTTDLVYLYDGATPATVGPGNNPLSSGLGLDPFVNDEDLAVLRSQLQILF